jgi:hypothetical protein
VVVAEPRVVGETRQGHAKYKCSICGQQAPDPKSMEAHHDSKHSKVTFDLAACTDMHEANGGVTTAGVAVRGSITYGTAAKKKEAAAAAKVKENPVGLL